MRVTTSYLKAYCMVQLNDSELPDVKLIGAKSKLKMLHDNGFGMDQESSTLLVPYLTAHMVAFPATRAFISVVNHPPKCLSVPILFACGGFIRRHW